MQCNAYSIANLIRIGPAVLHPGELVFGFTAAGDRDLPVRAPT